MAEWEKTTLEKCTDILGDGLHGTPKYTDGGEYAFINGNNLVNGEILIKKDTKMVDYSQYEKYKKPLTNRTLLVSINGTLGNVGMYNSEKIILGKSACYFNVKEFVDKDFIYYVVSSPMFRQYLEHSATGTTIKNISLKQMREYEFLLPPIEKQKQISSVLKMIDEKIKNNRRVNENLYEQMLSIFNNARRTSAWNKHKLGDVLIFFDNLRKPLSSIQREKMAHIYPYYGAASIVDYVEDYLFDGTYILISEDGANVIDSFGHPLTQYTYGKFWVNNHAHIVKGSNDYSEALVYAMLGTLNMQSIVTGAAQPKINQANLRNFEAVLPESEEAQVLSELLNPMLQQMLHHNQENEKLSELRDILLPQLMSGALDVSAIDL